jgi:hypothetical protein
MGKSDNSFRTKKAKRDIPTNRGKGAPPLEERELTSEQQRFCMMVARGVDPKAAGGRCGFSDYQIRSYLKLEKIQDEITRWKYLVGVEGDEEWLKMQDEVQKAAHLALIKEIEDGKLTPKELIAFFDKKSVQLGTSDDVIRRKQIITEKVTKELPTTSKKQIELIEPDDEDVTTAEFDTKDFEGWETGGKEEVERSVEYEEEKGD